MIVAAITQALEQGSDVSEGDGGLMEQVSHLRTALREITTEISARRLPAQVRPEPRGAVRKRRVRAPKLVPPLSSTILEERRERV
jgi:hypothetical protein